MTMTSTNSYFGPMAPLETESLIESALQAFHVHLALADEKQEYLEALSKCPKLLKTEANPLKFLRVENYDARAAVKRFVLYWKYRKRAFQEKAFLPLRLGQALTKEDVKLMKTGYLTFLPRNSSGETVVLIEHDRVALLNSLPVGDSRIRLCFWMADLMNKAALSTQTQGMIGILAVTPFGFTLNRHGESPMKILTKTALPIKFGFQYFVQVTSFSTQGFMAYLLPLALNLFSGLVNQLLVPVFGSTREEVYAKLIRHGLEPEGIPPSLGGCFDHESFPGYCLANSQPDESSDVKDILSKEEDLCRLNQNVERAIAAMPQHMKADYSEARCRVPLVVEFESPVARFATCESLDDVGAVTQRLLEYWRTRRRVFGDRAFLPLTMSGQDALTTDDLRYLDRGFAAVLPQDDQGRPVVYLDYSRYDSYQEVSASSLHRLWFYSVHVAALCDAAQSQGIVVLLVLPEKGDGVRALAFDLLLQVMPIRLHMLYVLVVHSRPLQTSYAKTAIQEVLSAAGSSCLLNAAVHILPSRPAMLSTLQTLGFQTSNVPVALGGQWRFDIELPIWKYQQALEEQSRLSQIKEGGQAVDVYGAEDSDDDDEATPAKLMAGVSGNGSSLSQEAPADERVSAAALTISVGKAAIQETSTVISNGLNQLEEALAMLPPEDCAAFSYAVHSAPDLVEKETPLLPFLRLEGYNTWAGAERVASYWAMRQSAFKERALLAMNQSGEGTLTRDDVQALGAGGIMLLPYDRRGRTVFLFDCARIARGSKDRKLRLSLYLWSIASENELSQLDGCRVIIKLESRTFDNAMKESIGCCLDALPVRIHSVIATCSPENVEGKLALRKGVPTVVSELSQNWILLLAETAQELAAKFSALDIACEGLPESLGGTWSDEQFTRWQESRIRYEWKLPALPNNNMLMMPHVPVYTIKPRSELTETEKVERKRRRNVLNSRRKRDRTRAQVSGLQEQVSDLRKRNYKLESEHERLSRMLAQAAAQAVQGASSAPSETEPPRLLSVEEQQIMLLSSTTNVPAVD